MQSNNNETTTLISLILGIGAVLIVAIFISYQNYSETATSLGENGTVPTAEKKEDINTRVASLPTATQQVVLQGHELFENNCQQCHAIDKKVVGPALKNVHERKDEAWLVNFIKYPQKVIDSGDDYAQALYQEYQQYMPNHDFFSDEQVKSILTYVKFESGAEVGGSSEEETASAEVAMN